ncbi:asparagine synthase-related protein [Halorubrum sp. DTA98]|uniref:asparagine synthase C-terminal domain-containing protein n=1 Tax=Halorubrum sp. DTA98 TaxID=3402163 RepID=UPI003AB0404D
MTFSSDDGFPGDDGSTDDGTRLRGASPDLVRRAIRDRDPFPGTAGFAGRIGDQPGSSGTGEDEPALVRDVLGREPLFVERNAAAPTTENAWSFDPTTLRDPKSVDAGTLVTSSGPRTVWSLPTPDPVDPEAGQRAVDDALRAVLSELGAETSDDGDPSGRLAVAFSGGVDSGVVAAAVPEAPCYVAGFEGCHDVAAAREAAAAMGRDLRIVELTHDDLTRAIPEIVAATGRRNAMDLNIAVPLYLTAEAAAADGFDRLAVGQGADELFGGYSKVVDPANDHRVDAETVRDARDETVRTLPDQLERDVVTLRAAGVEPVAPLLDDRLVEAAIRLPDELLATPAERKIALRRAAAAYVPDPVGSAEKKAVQYGTYVAREIDRLARQNGFKRRMDGHVALYIESLLDGSTDLQKNGP